LTLVRFVVTGHREVMVTSRDVPRPGAPAGMKRQPLLNRLVLTMLRSPLRRPLGTGTTALRYLAADGHQVTLPVGFIDSGRELVVLVGQSSSKRWWRHFLTPGPVDVLLHGAWRSTTAQAFPAGTQEHDRAAAAYGRRHPRVTTSDDPVVLVTVPAGSGAAPPRSAGV